MIPMAFVDPEFAKEQLILFCREWFMHPNGQLPAYEWDFGDVNPPVHAWAAWRVYKIDARNTGVKDYEFLERVFHKLLINFSWWVNRKDAHGSNVFDGGFLGLDNIGVFDRSAPLPGEARLEQSDATSWMAMFCLNMLAIALELAHHDRAYEDVATKFFEHFLAIADAMNNIGHDRVPLWDDEDGFFYDVLSLDGEQTPIRIRSIVGLIPMFAVETLDPDVLESLPDFRARMRWFQKNRPDLCGNIFELDVPGEGQRRLLSILDPDRLRRVLGRMLDEDEFLSEHGVRSLSRWHESHPVTLDVGGHPYRIDYEPAESGTWLFDGNSNWRGPVWFPINFLLVESLQKFHHYLGDDYTVEMPTGSGRRLSLWEVAGELSDRLVGLFLADGDGRTPGERRQRPPRPRPLVARPGDLLRVFPRRHRRRPRGQPPDGLDRPGGQAHPPDRPAPVVGGGSGVYALPAGLVAGKRREGRGPGALAGHQDGRAALGVEPGGDARHLVDQMAGQGRVRVERGVGLG